MCAGQEETTMSLVICTECNRHIRRYEGHCPFCSAAISPALAASPPRPLPTGRLSRAAILAFAAASLGTACGGKDTDTRAGDGNGNTGGASGAPGAGGTVSAGGVTFGGFPVGGGVPIYGAPSSGYTGAGGFGVSSGGASGTGGFPGSSGLPGTGGYSIPPPPPPYGTPPPPPPLMDAGTGTDSGEPDAATDASDEG
jgi:hypothetical protein